MHFNGSVTFPLRTGNLIMHAALGPFSRKRSLVISILYTLISTRLISILYINWYTIHLLAYYTLICILYVACRLRFSVR